MTKEEKQKAINALKISTPIVCVTKEEFNTYIQTLNKVIDWLEQESSILDEMKADIEKLDGMYVLRNHVFYAEKDIKDVQFWYIRLKDVIDIIDKYRTESEE